MDKNTYITVKEFCEIYKFKSSKAYALVQKEQVPHYRIDKLIRFKLSEVEEWMESNKVDPIEVPYDKVQGF